MTVGKNFLNLLCLSFFIHDVGIIVILMLIPKGVAIKIRVTNYWALNGFWRILSYISMVVIATVVYGRIMTCWGKLSPGGSVAAGNIEDDLALISFHDIFMLDRNLLLIQFSVVS